MCLFGMFKAVHLRAIRRVIMSVAILQRSSVNVLNRQRYERGRVGSWSEGV